MTTEGIFLIMELIGTMAFSISGALIAIEKNMDLFGVLSLGVITALGGGATRDLLIGNLPPAMFVDYKYIIVALASALLVFVVAKIKKTSYFDDIDTIDKINNIFDAIGLGAFTVTGINVTQSMGFGDNALLLIIMGMITGIGGGMIRDIFASRVPFVLEKNIYASASIIGGILYYFTIKLHMGNGIGIIVGVGSVFAIRMLATAFDWNLPKAFTREEFETITKKKEK